MGAQGNANVIYRGAGWGWCGVLVLAPWLYGGTRAWSVDWLNAVGGASIGLWLLGLLLERRRPAIPSFLVGVSLLLLGLGWCLALNSHLLYRADYFTFLVVPQPVLALPSGVDSATAIRKMTQISVFLGGLGLVADMSVLGAFRRAVWVVLGGTGASVALYGLAQKALQDPLWLWDPVQFDSSHFAGFRYHANAGAFLNLVWPLLAGLAVMSFRRTDQSLVRTLWVGGTAAAFFATFANVSKAAFVVAGLLFVGVVSWAWGRLSRDREEGTGVLARKFVAGLGCVLGVLLLGMAWERWQAGGLQSAHSRWGAYLISWKMVGDSGAFGMGPGTWSLCFPFYTGDLVGRTAGIWRFAHQDYLQTLVEWGWAGISAWAALVLGGLVSGVRVIGRGPGWLKAEDNALLWMSCLAIVGVFLHAFVDFPLQIASIQFYTVTLLGLAWGSLRWPQRSRRRKSEVPPEPEVLDAGL